MRYWKIFFIFFYLLFGCFFFFLFLFVNGWFRFLFVFFCFYFFTLTFAVGYFLIISFFFYFLFFNLSLFLIIFISYFKDLFLLNIFWYSIFVSFKSVMYSCIVLSILSIVSWKLERSFLNSRGTSSICSSLVFIFFFMLKILQKINYRKFFFTIFKFYFFIFFVYKF